MGRVKETVKWKDQGVWRVGGKKNRRVCFHENRKVNVSKREWVIKSVKCYRKDKEKDQMRRFL